MRKQHVDFETVRELGLALPDVKDGTMYGSPALKLNGDLLACIAIHKSAEPQTLAVRLDTAMRDELVASEPRIYYLTPHYTDYPIVLVRMPEIGRAALGDLLKSSWRFVSSRSHARKRGPMAARSRIRRQ